LKGDYLTILGRFVAEIEKVAERDAEPVCGASRWATGRCGGGLNEPVSENGRPAGWKLRQGGDEYDERYELPYENGMRRVWEWSEDGMRMV
jgi:hypothetical protein